MLLIHFNETILVLLSSFFINNEDLKSLDCDFQDLTKKSKLLSIVMLHLNSSHESIFLSLKIELGCNVITRCVQILINFSSSLLTIVSHSIISLSSYLLVMLIFTSGILFLE